MPCLRATCLHRSRRLPVASCNSSLPSLRTLGSRKKVRDKRKKQLSSRDMSRWRLLAAVHVYHYGTGGFQLTQRFTIFSRLFTTAQKGLCRHLHGLRQQERARPAAAGASPSARRRGPRAAQARVRRRGLLRAAATAKKRHKRAGQRRRGALDQRATQAVIAAVEPAGTVAALCLAGGASRSHGGDQSSVNFKHIYISLGCL